MKSRYEHLVISVVIIAIVCLYFPIHVYSKNLPSFKVVWHKGTAVNLLVPKNTTDEELENLVLALRNARQTKTLAKMGIPKTSMPIDPPLDPNATIFILIFNDPRWASASEAKQYENTLSQKVVQAYLDHVKASYVYFAPHILTEWEVGALGYHEPADAKSAHYKEFFHSAPQKHVKN